MVLTLSPPNKLSSASIFKVLLCHPKLMQMLSYCQTAWIRMRCRVTRHLIRIQAVCIWHLGCDLLAKGSSHLIKLNWIVVFLQYKFYFQAISYWAMVPNGPWLGSCSQRRAKRKSQSPASQREWSKLISHLWNIDTQDQFWAGYSTLCFLQSYRKHCVQLKINSGLFPLIFAES